MKNTRSFLPVKPVISPFVASTTVDVSTSPDPVTSTMSTIFGFPSDVTLNKTMKQSHEKTPKKKNKEEEKKRMKKKEEKEK